MPDIYRAQVVMESTSALAEDRVVNVFHFMQGPDSTSADSVRFTRIRDIVRDFYNAMVAPYGQSVANHLHGSVSRDAGKAIINVTKRPAVYMIDGKETWGSPDEIYNLNLGSAAAGTDHLPREVAAVLSYRADYGDEREKIGTSRPRARRRGRLFIGPLRTSAIATDGLLDRNFTGVILGAARRLRDAGAAATDDVSWAVYSPTTKQAHRVITGHIDNAPDTQRRRGVAAPVRDVMPA